jgi:predicted permease
MNEILLPKLASLILIFTLGFFLGKRQLLSEEAVRGLAWLIIDVTMAALFFSGILDQGATLTWESVKTPLFGGLFVPLAGLALAWPFGSLLRLKTQQRGAFLFLSSIGNSSFLPLPLAYALWGEQGTLACLIFVLSSNAVLFTLGILVLKHGKIDKNVDFSIVFRHPQLLSFLAGLAVLALGLKLPAWVLEPIGALGKTTLPLSMLAVGAILAQTGREGALDPGSKLALLLSGAIKLGALPCAVYFSIKCLNLKGFQAGLVLLEAAMPSLASAGVYAKRFGGDAKMASRGSLISTLCCPLSLPFWMGLWAAASNF